MGNGVESLIPLALTVAIVGETVGALRKKKKRKYESMFDDHKHDKDFLEGF